VIEGPLALLGGRLQPEGPFPMTLKAQLIDLLGHPERTAQIKVEAVPALLGELEAIHVRLLARLLTPRGDRSEDQSEQVPGTLLSVQDVATHLKLTPGRVYELVRRDLPTVRIGKFIRVRPADLQAWLEEHRIKRLDIRTGMALGSSTRVRNSNRRKSKD
jgi:excisionase family DNA binding protein